MVYASGNLPFGLFISIVIFSGEVGVSFIVISSSFKHSTVLAVEPVVVMFVLFEAIAASDGSVRKCLHHGSGLIFGNWSVFIYRLAHEMIERSILRLCWPQKRHPPGRLVYKKTEY